MSSVNTMYCKFIDIRNQYLLNWYTLNNNLRGFFNILNSSDEKVIHRTAVYINKLLSIDEHFDDINDSTLFNKFTIQTLKNSFFVTVM